MKNTFTKLVFVFSAILFIAGCEETTVPEDVAKQLSVEQAKVEPGFTWLESAMITYTPDTNILKQIKNAYASNPNRSVVVYVNPSCSCDGSRVRVPQALRSLLEAGIPESKISIYVMRTSKAKHPYSDRYTLKGLPNIYILKGGKTVFFIESDNEAIRKYGLGETAKPIIASDKIESVLAEGFAH